MQEEFDDACAVTVQVVFEMDNILVPFFPDIFTDKFLGKSLVNDEYLLIIRPIKDTVRPVREPLLVRQKS